MPSSEIEAALSSLKAMLAADGYELDVDGNGPDMLVARISAGPQACEDCLVPKDMMRRYFIEALRPVWDAGMPEIRLLYPGDPD